MSAPRKQWELHLKIVTETKREAETIRALINDITDRRKPLQTSETVFGTRRYRKRGDI